MNVYKYQEPLPEILKEGQGKIKLSDNKGKQIGIQGPVMSYPVSDLISPGVKLQFKMDHPPFYDYMMSLVSKINELTGEQSELVGQTPDRCFRAFVPKSGILVFDTKETEYSDIELIVDPDEPDARIVPLFSLQGVHCISPGISNIVLSIEQILVLPPLDPDLCVEPSDPDCSSESDPEPGYSSSSDSDA